MDEKTFNKLEKIDIDYNEDWVPQKARKLKPQLFKDGDSYSCIFGPDPEVGIFGHGNTPEEAVNDWERDLKERIERLTEGDDAAHHAYKHLSGHL